jgi:glycosyltransferase involved in cell wall biosynthesis
MSKLNVLVYIDWFSPGFKAGGPIRSMVNMSDRLSSSICFHIITSDRDYMSEEPYLNLKLDTWISYGEVHKVYYVNSQNLGYSGLKKATEGMTFDKIYVNGIFSRFFSIYPLFIHRKEREKLIIAPRGMLRASAKQFKSKRKGLYLRMARALGNFKGVTFHGTDNQEKIDINSWFSGSRIRLAPNLPAPLPAFKSMRKESGSVKICFIGRIALEKNLIFALQVLSSISDRGIEFGIYGAMYDMDYWKDCEKEIEGMENRIKVTYQDSIAPDEVIPLLQSYHLLFLPTKGENFGHVILEAFMAGRPVLTSDQTPWQGLDKKGAGANLPLGNPESFKEAIHSYLLMSDSDFQTECKAAYAIAEEFCGDKRIIEQAKAVFLP